MGMYILQGPLKIIYMSMFMTIAGVNFVKEI